MSETYPHGDCGHSDAEHEQMHDLIHLVHSVQMIDDPRVAFVVTESGSVHFACSIPPGEAASMLEEMARKLRRYPANYVREHFTRAHSAAMN